MPSIRPPSLHPLCSRRFPACRHASPAFRAGARITLRLPSRRIAALAIGVGIALTVLTAGCGQYGPLRLPGETTSEARSQAESRRLPQNRRDAPVPSADPSNAPTKQP